MLGALFVIKLVFLALICILYLEQVLSRLSNRPSSFCSSSAIASVLSANCSLVILLPAMLTFQSCSSIRHQLLSDRGQFWRQRGQKTPLHHTNRCSEPFSHAAINLNCRRAVQRCEKDLHQYCISMVVHKAACHTLPKVSWSQRRHGQDFANYGRSFHAGLWDWRSVLWCSYTNKWGLRLLQFAIFNNLVMKNTLGPTNHPEGGHGTAQTGSIKIRLTTSWWGSDSSQELTSIWRGVFLEQTWKVTMASRVRLKKTKKPTQSRLRFDLKQLRYPYVAGTFEALKGGEFATIISLRRWWHRHSSLITTYNTVQFNT